VRAAAGETVGPPNRHRAARGERYKARMSLRPRRSVALTVAIVQLLLPGIGAAQGASPPEAPPAPVAAQQHASPVSIDWTVDGAITGSALALWLGTELAKDSLTPPSCRWCATNGLDVSVRNELVWSNPGRAGTASDLMVVAIPAGIALRDVLAVGSAREAVPDLVIIAEAMAISGFLSQTVKFASARERPYALYGTLPSAGADDRLSFYSGHTTIAFSAVAAGGMLAQMRGDPAWPWIYGVGFTAAAATGYFRLAADRHWFTDVLMGAASGTAVGLAVPWLHRNQSGAQALRVSLAPRGIALSGDL
jgi:membrane-associated phospholipid phosphatase